MAFDGVSRRTLLAGLAGCGLSSPAIGAVRAGGVTDLMPAFWQAMDATAGEAPTERAQRIAETYLIPNSAVFQAAGLPRIMSSRIASWLTDLEPMLPAIRALDARIDATWLANQAIFRREFPDFDPLISPTYFMMSLFSFDAHLEAHDGVLPLFVGLDGIVRYHGPDADLAVLLSHELFHCEHAQRSPGLVLQDSQRLYKALWGEGLATYVSERMNPKASRQHVLLDNRLDEQGDAFVPIWARAMLERLDSTLPEDHSRFFRAGYTGEGPARGGYLVGLLIARRLGRDRRLAELAALPAPQVRRLMESELRRLAPP